MKSWKVKFLEKEVLGRGTDLQDTDKVVSRCVKLAYKDMMTAGRYYSNEFLHDADTIRSEIVNILNNSSSFSRDLIAEVSLLFSEHEIIGVDNKNVTRYGLAQKLVNMSFKYLYIFGDYIFTENNRIDFSNCDCPLDRIILTKLPRINCTWSKITKEYYIQCQNIISEMLYKETLDVELKQIGNLAFDFINW